MKSLKGGWAAQAHLQTADWDPCWAVGGGTEGKFSAGDLVPVQVIHFTVDLLLRLSR